MAIFHARPYSRFIEIQSNLRRMKLHRTNEGTNFLGGGFSNTDNVRGVVHNILKIRSNFRKQFWLLRQVQQRVLLSVKIAILQITSLGKSIIKVSAWVLKSPSRQQHSNFSAPPLPITEKLSNSPMQTKIHDNSNQIYFHIFNFSPSPLTKQCSDIHKKTA